MSRTFYPSDEYDSIDLERARAKRRSTAWWKKRWQNDDDDSPPPAAAAAPLPKAPSLGGSAAQAA